ncbi:type VII secretion-associated protein [Pseudonocardia abyssalis]|uniref:Type VII secretion-associated protein n=1 Tax=Pseudonocardia abyssalis TaxID=2792008 RepID=A0ABS6V0T5_9PSEU|nr:type VII secretion-associated protein [Pseudonocardia abyssalis]MBW0117961.1 type VII secretion-associated protein [Pseudonocardia abyssalis]MBW0138106.1 type VII secretion-associated protein [Pseudonocardia abyssalis]
MRAAVQPGSTVVRVARPGPDGTPRVVEVPVEPGVPLPVLLRGLVEGEPLLVTGPVVAESVAAGRREVVVVDVGSSGTEVSLVRAGRIAARRRGPGGDRLDRAVATLLGTADRPRARGLREAASLHEVNGPVTASEVRGALAGTWAEVVDAVRAVGRRPEVPVLLIGGGARTPDLAEHLDAAGFRDVVVAARPDAAAVLAVRAPSAPPRAVGPAVRWLPDAPPRTRRPLRVALVLAAAVVALGSLHVLGRAVGPGPEPPPAGLLAQYGYRLAVPPGWAHTGGLPERRRSLLTPLGAPEGSDLIAVEATPLGYDASAEPQRAAAELRAEFDAAGPGLSGYDPVARFGGRAVTAYRERDGVTEVAWYVVIDGGTQLSVGCRHTPSGTASVRDACALVVATIRGGG